MLSEQEKAREQAKMVRKIVELNQNMKEKKEENVENNSKTDKTEIIGKNMAILKKSKPRYVSNKDNSRKIKILSTGIAAALGIGYAVGHIHQKTNDEKNSNKYVIALAKDFEGDEYDQAIPLQSENGNIIEIPDKGLIIVKNSEIKKGEKNNKAYAIKNGQVVEGEVQGKYLDLSDIQLSPELLEEYDGIYKVKPEIGANLRDSTTIVHSNILKGVAKGEIVLGGDTIMSKTNEYQWKPVIYINENEVAKGYIQADLLEKVDTLQLNPKKKKESGKKENSNNVSRDELQDLIKMQVNTDRDQGEPLHLREQPSTDSEVLLNLENGKKILVAKTDLDNMVENDGRKWVKIIIGNYEGYVVVDYLEEDLIKMQVNTDRDQGEPLHLREQPSTDSEVLLNLENGKKILVAKTDLDNMVENDGRKWVKIIIGNYEGYVAVDYLEEVKEQQPQIGLNENSTMDEIKESVISKIALNQKGSVSGIDVSSMTPEQLEYLYYNGITASNINAGPYGQIDISDINGQINYVMIRIGGTYELNSNFEMDNIADTYLPLVKKCEELGIPYGFYYYTAAVNENEALQEYEKIKNDMESIKGEIGDLKYNLLPFAVDVEVDSNYENVGLYDRHVLNGVTIQDVTNAKVVLTNKLKEYLGDRIILYGAGKAVTPYMGAQILDLQEYQRLTGIKDVWMPLPKEEFANSDVAENNKQMKNIIEADGNMQVIMQQAVLDYACDGYALDIDVIDKDKYIELIRGKNREQSHDEAGFEIGE